MHLYLELSKARLTSLVVLTTAAGYVMAGDAPGPGFFRTVFGSGFFWTVLGTALSAGGANALNQWIEQRRDALMERTRERPLPSGRLTSRHGLLAGMAMAAAGVATLAIAVNLLTAALGAFVVLLYTLVYTPMKHRSPFCTLVGAICGAVPPMMGWTGAEGRIGYGAWILAAILFLWQIPHFLALAWLYRQDYARGGYRMLPSIDPSGRTTGALAIAYTVALLPLGFFALWAGLAGWWFLGASLVLGAGFLVLGWKMRAERTDRSARLLFLASLIYLPLTLGLMVVDRGPIGPVRDYQSAVAGPASSSLDRAPASD